MRSVSGRETDIGDVASLQFMAHSKTGDDTGKATRPWRRHGIDLFLPFWLAILTSVARLPLHALPAFRTVAELQNLRAAAEVLHITHSAVSQQIRGLEEQLGFKLFERQRPARRAQPRGRGAAAKHANCAAAPGRRRAGGRRGRDRLDAAAARDGVAVVRAALAVAAHRPLARAPPASRAGDRFVAAARRPAARGLPRGAALRPRTVARAGIGATLRHADAHDRRRVAVDRAPARTRRRKRSRASRCSATASSGNAGSRLRACRSR